MTLEQLFLSWRDQYCDHDKIYGAQCVDLIKQYFKDVLNREPFKGNAIDYWTKDVPGFEKIKRTMFNRPEPGDLIIWDTRYGRYGHIGIVAWSRFFDFGCFEQNDPLGSPCKFKDRTYKYVVGWLRPIKTSPYDTYIFKAAVIGPVENDQVIIDAAKFVDQKLREFSNNKLGFEIIDWHKQNIKDPTPQSYFITDDAIPVFKGLNYKIPNDCDYVLVRVDRSSIWTYTVVFDQIWPVPFTVMPSDWTNLKDSLLFEVGHALVECYNIKRGSYPSISNFDNYSGGEGYVKEKVNLLLPYLDVLTGPMKGGAN